MKVKKECKHKDIELRDRPIGDDGDYEVFDFCRDCKTEIPPQPIEEDFNELFKSLPGIDQKTIRDHISSLLLSKEEEVKKVIEESRGEDYHNIGIGELDYHEKSAVDAYIETLKHRLLDTLKR